MLFVKFLKIVCVGFNYKDYVKELGFEFFESFVLFLKFLICVIGYNDSIIYLQYMSSQVDYEGEFVVVIKKECCNVKL